MQPIRTLAAFAVAGLIGVFGVAATAAPAAATANLHASASSAVALTHAKAPSPAIDNVCPYHSDRFVTWYGSCSSYINWSCTVGNEHSISPPTHVSNACPRNVILYTNSNETGSTLCIALDSRTGTLFTAWHSFRVILGGC
jgi:hypothetical protein